MFVGGLLLALAFGLAAASPLDLAGGLPAVAATPVNLASGLAAVTPVNLASGLAAVTPINLAAGLAAVAATPVNMAAVLAAATTPVDLLAAGLVLHLNTRLNPVTAQIISTPSVDATTWTSQFDASKPTKVLIHGFLDRYYMPWWRSMVQELLTNGDFNVIRVDWSALNLPPYTTAALVNTRVVGSFIGAVLLQLRDQYGADISQFHLIGHSLGAHISGYAGEMLRASGAVLGRITGLDPAGPYFTNMSTSARLDPTDAKLVDTIVTDGKDLLNAGVVPAFGSTESMGHLNFYPNDGKNQPGCSKKSISHTAIPMFNPFTLDLDGLNNLVDETAVLLNDVFACSHTRSVALFTASINNALCTMQAYECKSYEQYTKGACLSCAGGRCTTFGYQVDQTLAESGQTKKFYSITTNTSPFCRNPVF